MSGADAAWLQMDEPTNLMSITAALTLARCPSPEALAEAVERLVARQPGLCRRAAPARFPLGGAAWVEDPDFRVDRHITVRDTPAPGGEAGLRALAGDRISRPLPQTRPPWQLVLTRHEDGSGALLLCAHHSLMDSSAAMSLLLSLTDSPPGDARDEAHTPDSGALTKLMSTTADTPTVLRGILGTVKRAALSEPVPVADARWAAAALNTTVVGALLAAATGALRTYLEGRASLVESIGAFAQVDLRPLGATAATGNRFGLSHVNLPVGRIGPRERVEALREQGFAPDIEPPMIADFALLATLGRAPAAVERLVMSFFGARASAALVEHSGGPDDLTLCGEAVTGAALWPARAGGLGLGLGLVQLAGQARLSVVTDASLVPDPQAIADGFVAAFEELMALAPAGVALEIPDEPTVELPAEDAGFEAAVDLLDELAADAPTAAEAPPEQAAPAPVAEQPASVDVRCAGTTKAGKPCRGRPVTGSDYCRMHQPAEPEPVDPEPWRCAGLTRAGTRCKRRVKGGATRCAAHSQA